LYTRPLEKIDGLFVQAIGEMEVKRQTFARLEEEPELILKELFDPTQKRPYYAFPFLVFERCRELGVPECDYHWLQDYLVELVSRHLKEIDSGVKVVAREKDYYSSPCVILYGDYPVAQFDFYEHTFADLRNGYRKALVKAVEDAVKARDTAKEEADRWERYCSDPSSMVQGTGLRRLRQRLTLLLHGRWVKVAACCKAEVARVCLERAEERVRCTEKRLHEYDNRRAELDERYVFWDNYFVGTLGYKKVEAPPWWPLQVLGA